MKLKDYSKALKQYCMENPNWYDDDLLLNEDPSELARYGIGHMDERRFLDLMEKEIIDEMTDNCTPIDMEDYYE